MYYELVKSPDDLVGVEGFLRLPTYIFDEYVFDSNRENALKAVLEAIKQGKNVLIVGRAGAGKTAFLAIVLKRLMDRGYRIAKIINGEIVRREHEDKGIFLFYDDIPRIEKNTAMSIVENRAKMIIATARTEEFDDLTRKINADPRRYFEIVEISEMSSEDLGKILNRFARREGIEVDPEAARIVVLKARNLPVYIWQVIRDLTIARKTKLDAEFAKKIPEGMLEYVDRILWNVLGDKEDRKEVLLTLMIMINMPEYEMHQDLFNAVFVEATREIKGIEAPSRTILLRSDTLDRVCRYLSRTPRYSFRLPHDSWADVLKGQTGGLLSGLLSKEISSLLYIFPADEQLRILRNAARRAYDESISKSKDPERIREFFRQINLLGFGKEVLESPPEVAEAPQRVETVSTQTPKPPSIAQRVPRQIPRTEEIEVRPTPPVRVGEKIKLKLYATVKRVKSYRTASHSIPVKLSDISEAIFQSETYRSICNLSRTEALRRLMYRKMGKVWTIKYPCWGELAITETLEPITGKSEDEKIRDFIILVIISFFFLIIPIIGPLIFLVMFIAAFAQLFSSQWIYLSEIVVEGDRNTVTSLVKDIRVKIARRPIHITPRIVRAIRRKLGLDAYVLERQWYSI